MALRLTQDAPCSTLCVIGLGHVGACAALLASEAGFQTIGVDTDPARLAACRDGNLGAEPGLSDRWATADIQLSPVPVPADITLVCVPTPLASDQTADLTALRKAVDSLDNPGLLIIESTVPVGTTQTIADQLGQPVAIAPERILPANALAELATVPRVVGGTTPDVARKAAQVYRRLSPGAPISVTTATTAELCKLAENATRDLQIAFANQLEATAINLGVNPTTLFTLVNSHPRVSLLTPGPGVGGHCLPVDPWFLANGSPTTSTLIATARGINDQRPQLIAQRILAITQGSIGVLGLAYKPNTGDIRHAPAAAIIAHLSRFRTVCSHDPHVTGSDSLANVQACDTVVKLVDHAAFASVRFDLGPTGRPDDDDAIPQAAKDL